MCYGNGRTASLGKSVNANDRKPPLASIRSQALKILLEMKGGASPAVSVALVLSDTRRERERFQNPKPKIGKSEKRAITG
jgi:hypothetical protein